MNQERAEVRIVDRKEQQAGLRVKDDHKPGENQAFSEFRYSGVLEKL